MEDIDIVKQVQVVNDWIILSTLTVVELFVLIKMKFKVDFSGILTLFTHFFVSLMRLIDGYIVSDTGGAQIILYTIGANMIWFSLYYFTCELLHIKNSLESDEHQIYQKQRRFIQIIKHATFIIILLFAASQSVIQYFLFNEFNVYKENIAFFNGVLASSRTIKIAVDLYFHIKFFQMFRYLVKKSELKSKENGKISRSQEFIKISILFLFCVSFVQAGLVYCTTFPQILDPNFKTSSFSSFIIFASFVIFPIKDFFIALLFSYLYYVQGKKMRILFNEQLKVNDDFFYHMDNDPSIDWSASQKLYRLKYVSEVNRTDEKQSKEGQSRKFSTDYLETISKSYNMKPQMMNLGESEQDHSNVKGDDVLGSQFNDLMNSLQDQKEKEFKQSGKGTYTSEIRSMKSMIGNENTNSPSLFQNSMFINFIISDVIRGQ